MPNQASVLLSGQTYLVYLRHNDCGKGFFDAACKKYYKLKLLNSLRTYQVKLHSFCILDNEVYLLGTPMSPTGFAALINYVNRSYTEYFNQRYERKLSGWCQYIRSSFIQGNQLVLDCQKYVERSPLQENCLSNPGMYEFSSHCSNCFGGKSDFLVPHIAFTNLLTNTPNPYRYYREFVASPFPHAYQLYLEKNLKHGKPIAKREKPLAIPIALKRRYASGPPG
jgi:REP element-mobilizing transposase RayT